MADVHSREIEEKLTGASLRTYLLHCARAMEQCADQQTHLWDVPVVLPLEQPDDKPLVEAEEELRNLAEMSHVEVDDQWRKASASALRTHQDAVGREVVRMQAYLKMRAKVEAWEPGNPNYDLLKSFALRVIDEEVKRPPRFETAEFWFPEKPEWYSRELRQAAQRVVRIARELSQEHARRVRNRAWIVKLYEVLPRAEG